MLARAVRRLGPNTGLIITYALLMVVLLATAFPYLYMLSISLMTEIESVAVPIRLLPEVPQWSNLSTQFERLQMAVGYLNSLIVAGGNTLIVLFTSSIAGYGFAKYRFRGRDLLFTLMLGSMTIPAFIYVLPLSWMVRQVHLYNTLVAAMIPTMVMGFGVFMMRQFMVDLPDELIDAARIDGASEFSIFWRVILPLCPSALATLGSFVFLYHWNDLLWPSIVLTNRPQYTVNLVAMTQTGYYLMGNRNLAIAAMTLAVAPVILVVFLFQRYIVEGVALTGLKG